MAPIDPAMRCSAVIPCHNGVDLTAACIESLLRLDGRPDLEILVVDNASEDGTKDLGDLSPRVRVLRQERNLGFAGGVNAGVRAATAPHLLILNNDTQAAPSMLSELTRALASHPDLAAVAPVANDVRGEAQMPFGNIGRDATGRGRIAAALAEHPPLQDVDYLSGLCLLVPRATFELVGLFDERFGFGNFEDDDFSLRLRLRGKRLGIARRAYLHHEGHATFRAMGLDLGAEIDARRQQFAAKWRHDPAGAAVLAALRGDVQAAGAAAEVARRRWPQWIDAEWHLARAAAARGQHHLAITHFEALLRANPRHSSAATEALVQRLAVDDEGGAVRLLEHMRDGCYLSPEQMARIFTRFGLHYRDRGDRATALEQFRAALEFEPTNGELHNWIGVCTLDDDLDAAQRAFTMAVERGCALGHTNLGIVFHRRGDLARAAHHFTCAAAELPDDPIVAANLSALRELAPV
ncbi:MAG: glycosyltransferase [Planctomycetes bacterium]|nr:glycosyltransferase [Planctomycetota bacterium]MCB9887769.1 glycosyltransferase [Planctomycetota bacterium]